MSAPALTLDQALKSLETQRLLALGRARAAEREAERLADQMNGIRYAMALQPEAAAEEEKD